MRIAWATDYEALGNGYGHTIGNRMGREAATRAGLALDPDAEIAVHHCPPHNFKPIPGKVNVLWFAWEFADFTPTQLEGIRRADVAFVTAKFLLDAVGEHAPEVPVYYVPQGIRTETFPYVQRRRPVGCQPFRFLWLGAPNDRKGWRHVLGAWHSFQRKPRVELYLKTTFASGALPDGLAGGNIIIDTERVSDERLAALYASAHCFLFPSLGEGFGFTLGEAMASGLPCITTLASSLTDLASPREVYPVRHVTRPCFDVDGLDGKTYTLPAAWPDINHLVAQMLEVIRHYPAALKRGKLAARRIRRRFTWRQSGVALREALEEVNAALQEVRT